MLDGTRVIDVHHHFLPRNVFDQLKAEAGGGLRLVNERISITLREDLHSVAAHLQTMDEGNVDTAILTYSGVSHLGMDTCRGMNDGFATIQREHRPRLFGAVHVSLEEPEAAVPELERGVRELGLVAIALPTSAGRVTLDSPTLGPLWRKIQELDTPIILHPALLPQGAPTDYGMERSCARPFDTTYAATRIMNRVFPEFPNLKFVLPHLGGTSIFLYGRISMISFEPPDWDIPPEKRLIAKTQREQQALGLDVEFRNRFTQFYFDTAGTGGWAPALEMTAAVAGARRMLFGSDFPLETTSGATVGELVDMIGNLRLPPEERHAIAGETAAQLFKI